MANKNQGGLKLNAVNKLLKEARKINRIVIKKELYASEVLERTFKEIIKKQPNRQVVFSELVSTVIADDSDHHRSRTGYMVYREVRILQFNGKHWAIGLGEARGDYPARSYGRGIIAVKILPDESVGAEEIAEKIQIEGGFSNLLLISKYGTVLTIANEDFFCESASINLMRITLEYSIQYSEIKICYKTDLVKVLTKLIPQILAES